MRIADLPFRERPILELLAFDLAGDRREVDWNYAGYGWARVPSIWLVDEQSEQRVDDVLVLGLHAADDGAALPDDIELVFELPDNQPDAIVLASQFFDVWLPTLPAASAVVLALCNPHRAALRTPAAARVPIYIATGDVESWLDEDKGGRLELCAEGSWARLSP